MIDSIEKAQVHVKRITSMHPIDSKPIHLLLINPAAAAPAAVVVVHIQQAIYKYIGTWLFGSARNSHKPFVFQNLEAKLVIDFNV